MQRKKPPHRPVCSSCYEVLQLDERNAGPETHSVVFDGRTYTLKGTRWYDEVDYIVPPKCIQNKLNRLVANQLAQEDEQIVDPKELLRRARLAHAADQLERARWLLLRAGSWPYDADPTMDELHSAVLASRIMRPDVLDDALKRFRWNKPLDFYKGYLKAGLQLAHLLQEADAACSHPRDLARHLAIRSELVFQNLALHGEASSGLICIAGITYDYFCSDAVLNLEPSLEYRIDPLHYYDDGPTERDWRACQSLGIKGEDRLRDRLTDVEDRFYWYRSPEFYWGHTAISLGISLGLSDSAACPVPSLLQSVYADLMVRSALIAGKILVAPAVAVKQKD
jgi:hypothetical protein